MNLSLGPEDPQPAAMASLFERQRAAFAQEPYPAESVRRRRLAALESLLHDHGDDIAAAISADFGHRSVHESQLLELFPSLEGVRHARRQVGRWMAQRRRGVSLWFRPGRARVLPQPLGVAGIIAPWNYPIYLAAGPLTAALAAGNRCMVKMSELTPTTSRLFAELVARHFAPEEVAVVEGDATVAAKFAALGFDHLLFTGSTAVGRSVMRTAAESLTPVTLELGGKSPAIVASGYPLARAAQRIVLGKAFNAGQTCIAPDYVLVPSGSEAQFVAAARAAVDRLYPALAATPDYTHIVSPRHFARLQGYLEEARGAGTGTEVLSSSMAAADPLRRRMPPVALVNPDPSLAVMREEIFGPILPVIGYGDLEAALRFVNARPRPLALYYFDDDEARIERVLRHTVAGGVTINDTILHIAQEDLPFGGVGASGMGQYHGRAGFDTFSLLKPVFLQSRLSGVTLFSPPYGRRFERLVRLLIR